MQHFWPVASLTSWRRALILFHPLALLAHPRREGIGLGDAQADGLLAAWLGLPGALLAFGIGVFWERWWPSFCWRSIRANRHRNLGAQKAASGHISLHRPASVSGLWGQPIIHAYLHWAGF